MIGLKNRKPILKRITLAVIAVYLATAVTYSIYFYLLLNDIYNSNGTYGTGFETRVDEKLFDSLDFRSQYPDFGCEYSEHRVLLFPLTVHWFSGGKAFYMYSYTRKNAETGETLCGSWRIPVRLTFLLEHGHIKITTKSESP